MAEYFFENRKDRCLKAYLKLSDSMDSSYLMTFRLHEQKPICVLKGSCKSNLDLIKSLECIAHMKHIQIAQDEDIEWIPIPVTDDETKKDDDNFIYDTSICFIVKEYKQALNLL